MSEQETQSEVQSEIQNEAPVRKPPGLLRRFGCLILLVIWFAFVLSPCVLITLAQQGEITISQGELPNQYIRVWLIMEIDQRGVGISTTSQQEINGAQCLQTDVNFALWEGEEAPLSYCDCYARDDTASIWSLTSSQQGVCTP
jgi:hypothetical protein